EVMLENHGGGGGRGIGKPERALLEKRPDAGGGSGVSGTGGTRKVGEADTGGGGIREAIDAFLEIRRGERGDGLAFFVFGNAARVDGGLPLGVGLHALGVRLLSLGIGFLALGFRLASLDIRFLTAFVGHPAEDG